MTRAQLKPEIIERAQKLHDLECNCGSTDTSDIMGWIPQAERELQLFTWMQDGTRKFRPRILQKVRNFIYHKFWL